MSYSPVISLDCTLRSQIKPRLEVKATDLRNSLGTKGDLYVGSGGARTADASVHGFVAADRHRGQVGYFHSSPQEVRDEESGLQADPGEEGETDLVIEEVKQRQNLAGELGFETVAFCSPTLISAEVKQHGCWGRKENSAS